MFLILGIFVVVAVFLIVFFQEHRERKDTVEKQCEAWSILLSNRFGETSQQARLMSDLITTFYYERPNCFLDQSGFQSFGEKTKYSRPLMRGMSYAPLVTQSKAASFLQQNKLTCIRNITGQCEALEQNYAPFLFSALGGETGDVVVGLDAFSQPEIKEAIQRAWKNGTFGALTSQTDLSFVNLSQGVAQVYPVYNSSGQQTEAGCVGFLMAYYNMSAVWEGVLEESKGSMDETFIRLYDVTNMSEPVVLYQPSTHILHSGKGDSYVATYQATLGDPLRHYEMRCRRREKDWFPLAALYWALGVLLLWVAAMAFVWFTFWRMQRMRREYRRMEALKEQMRAAKVAAEAASKAKGTFLATMSHEIRTPMNGVIGMMNLLLQTPLDATQLDYVETARTSGRALCSLINDILDLSKIEAGRMELEKTRVDLRAEVDDVLSMFVERTRKKPQVEVAAFVHDAVPNTIVGDSLRFRQVLINLLSNSCKFTNKGHIFIVIRTASPDEDTALEGAHFSDGRSVARLSEERRTSIEMPPSRTSLEAGDPSAYLRLKRASWESAAGVARKAAHTRSLPSGTVDIRIEGQSRVGPSGAIESSGNGIVSERKVVSSQVSNPWSSSTVDVIRKDEWLTLSGVEAVESCNSWHRIRDSVDPLPGSRPVQDHRLDGEGTTGLVRLVVSVEDTGQGIPWASQGRLFKPFVQADTSTTRTHGGTGIGLSISQHLVALMGGRLAFTSRPKVGTTFFFDMTVPYERATAPSTPSSKRRLSNGIRSSDLQSRPAIVVDDRPVRQAVTASYLRRLRMDVYRADRLEDVPVILEKAKVEQERPEIPSTPLYAQDTGSPAASPQHSFPGPLVPVLLVDGETLSRAAQLSKGWRDVVLSFLMSLAGESSSSGLGGHGDINPGSIAESLHPLGGTKGITSWRSILLVREPAMEEEARDSGYDATLLKPLRKASLAGCLAQALRPASPPGTALSSGEMAPTLPMRRTARPIGSGASSPVQGQGSPWGAPSGPGASPLGHQGGNESHIGGVPGNVSPSESTVLEPAVGGGLAVPLAVKRSSPHRTVSTPGGEDRPGTSQMLSAALRGKHFLVVDDNMVNRKVIQKMLQRYSVDVVAVVGGPQAVEKMQPGHSFDCVLMDVQMPGMDGFEATRRIRAQETEHQMKHTPIFALTADIFFGTREKAMESGMDGFLSKPIEEDQLYKVIHNFFPVPIPPT